MSSNPLECPITLSIMRHPVLAPDGHTYEREAITKWISQHGTSPQTRAYMRVDQLVPNRAIADLIELTESNNRGDANENDTDSTNTDIDTVTKSCTTKPPSDTLEVRRAFLPEELVSVAKLTRATLHVVHDKDSTPVSARVHIQPPNPSVDEIDTSLTTPNHVCCVIDVSGSMGSSAMSKDENGNLAEDIGLSILDIVKYATNVIAESLNAQDRLSIITYGDQAAVALSPTDMTSQGKKKVKHCLSSIKLQSRTNLFAGIKLGIMQANEVGCEYVNSVFVLTDGVPTEHPPLGYQRSMAKVLMRYPIFGALSTFGFGYQLDSRLLADIAKIGGGYYSFIPDAGMVGTCFINALANCRCAYGIQPMLKISGCDFSNLANSGIVVGSAKRRILTKWNIGDEKNENISGGTVTGLTQDGCLETTLLENDIYVRLTPLRYGSEVDVMLKPILLKQNKKDIKIELIFDMVEGINISLDVSPEEGNREDELFHSHRTQFVKTAYNICLNSHDREKSQIFTDFVKDNDVGENSNSNLNALYEDMRLQASVAISDEFFDTWGKHFLLSLSMAHLHQFCNNFKDPGVQVYGTGVLFSSLQDSLDTTFEKIPLPVPSRNTGYVVKAKPMRMGKVFNNRNAVCVHGKTILTVKNPLQKTNNNNDSAISLLPSSAISYIPICAIQKGDLVLTANGTYAKVECLVETAVDEKTLQPPFDLVKVGQLCVTPYHPVKLNEYSGWQFPIHTPNSDWMVPINDQCAPAYSVYNLVLESGQRHKAVLMDGIESITLGHGITDNTTLRHSYFGTDKVISDLVRVDGGTGWLDGHVVLRESNVSRDNVSGRICHISEVKVDLDEGVTIMNNHTSSAPCTV